MAGTTQALQTIRGERPSAVDKLKPLARYAASNHLNLVLGLPLRNHAALTVLLRDLYDPASPNYHKYLTSQQFADRFSPSEQDYRDVAQFATSHGLRIIGAHDNRTLLDVDGSAADIETTFHVRMEVYKHPTEARTFYAADADPSMDLAVPILSVHGLDNFVLPRPMNLTTAFDTTNAVAYASGSGPFGNFIGYDFRAAYAPGVALTGAGQSIGLFELDGYNASDVGEYEIMSGLPAVPLTNVLVDDFNGRAGGSQTEVTLDIDMAICMAPGVSQVLVYEGTTPNDVLNRMATDDLARQLSCSWGNFSPALDTNREQIYEQFAAQGQTMFQASGDDGAYTGEVSPPSDDPNITVVGGTSLTTSGFGGPWLGETTWSGSGGGSSITFPLPPWQQGLSTAANGGSTAFRNIPDVAAMADSAIWLVAFGGMQGSIGGTSAATPLWAGFAALANQQAAAEGKRPIGFINPLLYAIGRSASFTSSYHDIIAGNNTNSTSPTQFFAVPGYDLCTGWGSPTGSNLINALVSPPDALQIFPATNLMSSGPGGGRFDPTSQSMLLTNIGLASFNWTAASTAPWLDIVPDSGTGISNGPAAIVNLSLNSLASNLPPGNYTATIWFTNLNDGVGQSRQLNLNVIVTSSVPAIVGPPLSQTALPGETVIFTVMPVGNAPLSYQWQEDSTNLSDGGDISGSGTATLTISNVSSAFAGTYSVIVSNALNFATSDGAVLTVTSVTGAGVTITDLYSFTGGGDGANPNGLMQASDGNFYGTAENGGIDSSGTVFQMTPAGIVATMHQFGQSGGSGFSPQAGLVQGTNGALYGTTTDGGAHGWGTIFEITTNGGLTTVYMFDGGDGAFPQEPMILDTDGDFYGTTSGGGADEHGEVFRLTPAGALTQVVSFDYDNGVNPNTLLEGMDGTLYGTTFDGGTNGGGIIFNIATDGTLNTLFSFSYTNGGFLPAAGLAQSPEGDFYGTTFDGGTFGHGTIFAMSQSDIVQTSNSFTGGNDGGHPSADLLQASDGNYYGTTLDGGPYNAGTVFRWTPGGALVTLVTFDGFNGANPKSRLVQGLDGNLYGTTQNGGASSNGVVFRVNINSPIVQITGQPAAQNAFVGANAVFSV
ncbi:MAG TPA: choice-of-anchor tandem repeat GloVer-containing protein, partial [Verrucomicrobiae bacterium]|nr:choice-of-anchor tandem repeat GloVer-containing protein [Verrucomicrobiae bacterium]